MLGDISNSKGGDRARQRHQVEDIAQTVARMGEERLAKQSCSLLYCFVATTRLKPRYLPWSARSIAAELAAASLRQPSRCGPVASSQRSQSCHPWSMASATSTRTLEVFSHWVRHQSGPWN